MIAKKTLEGLRVVDLTQVVSGAMASLFMAEFGAEVIKVEPPGGEHYRKAGYPIHTEAGDTNLNIMRFSRRKKSVTIDLKTVEGKELLARLIADADVLVENFRPGVLTRLGFDYDRLREINPRLIYTSISGFGHDDILPSPYRDRPTYAIIAEAMAGLMHLAGSGEGPPVWMGFAMADIYAGTLAFAGTLLALLDRNATGKGRRVDVAMYDGCLLMNDLALTGYSVLGEVMGPGRYSLQSPWGPYETKDGYVAIAVLSEAQWQSVCDVIGREDLKSDDRLRSGRHRSQHHDIVGPAVEEWTRHRTKEEAAELLLAAGIPAAPVNTAADVFASPQTEARRMLIDVDDPVVGPVKLVGNPIKLDDVPDVDPARIPALGEHTDEVLHGLLGLDGDEIRRLHEAGVV